MSTRWPNKVQKYLNIINYIVITREGEITVFNQYDVNIVEKTNIFEKICTLPKDLSELFYDKEHLISNRISGLFDGYSVKLLNRCCDVNFSPFDINVVFIESVSDVSMIDRNVIFISDKLETDLSNKIYNIKDIDRQTLTILISEIISKLDKSKIDYFNELKHVCSCDEKSEFIDFGDTYVSNVYTKSNLGLLSSIKNEYDYEKSDFTSDIEDQMEPFNRILFIKSHIMKTLYPPTILPQVDFLISDMSSNFDVIFKSDKRLRPCSLDEAIELIKNNARMNISSKNKYSVEYYKERMFIESLLSLRSASYLSINMKLDLPLPSIYKKLQDIGVLDRIVRKDLVNKAMLSLIYEYKKNTSNWFSYLDNKFSSNIKIISNLPIEWSYHDGLPVMVRHETSRIPVSPGDVASKLILDSEQVFLSIDGFKKVKVISSFSNDDPLKDGLRSKIKYIEEQLNIENEQVRSLLNSCKLTKNIDVNLDSYPEIEVSLDWSNVSTREELIEVLNENESAITIFDLHGAHNENEIGVIKLKNEVVSIYDLIGKVKVSPIVILSSCDTNPIDRNHYTTANAFFLAGAKTVLASALPIISHEASVFITRLLLRVKYYLPKRLEGGSGMSIRWSSFVTGMIRKTFYSEFLNYLQKNSLLSATDKNNLIFEIGFYLDPLNSDWHEKIISSISSKIEIEVTKVKQILEDDFMLPECLKYIQMGNPESIIVASKSHIPLESNKSSVLAY
ncbi:TPA: hypothetical protein ACX6QT_003583 [Photobacterium damselae]